MMVKTNNVYQLMKEHFVNLWNNIWFVVSACCFYLSLYARDEIRKRAIILAVVAAVIIAILSTKLKNVILNSNKYVLILSVLCVLGSNNYYEGLRGILLESSRFLGLCSYLVFSPSLLASTVVCLSWIGSFPFFMTVFCYLYQWITDNIIKELKKEWNRTDVIIFLSALGIILLLIVLLFNTSSCFYTTVTSYDVVYTADTPVFISGDVWTNLFHGENDYRQPLFAIVSAPFFSPFYLVKRLVPGTFYFMAVWVCLIHASLMIVSSYLISTIIISKRKNRWLFVGLYMSMYSSLLFVVMMEQFTVATFWVLIMVYSVCNQKKNGELAWMCATGSLTTSIVLLPFVCFKNEMWNNLIQQMIVTIKNGIKFFLYYLCVVCLFTRYDAIKQFIDRVMTPGFVSTDKHARLIQFLNFPYTCFLEPNSEVIDYGGHMAWFMKSTDNVNKLSVIILLISLCGGILYLCGKKGFITIHERILGGFVTTWILFSVFVLYIYGWGTGEGALVLYSLYFGWAYFIGGFLFARRFLRPCLNENLVLVCGTFATVILCFINVRSLWIMASNLAPYYPLI